MSTSCSCPHVTAVTTNLCLLVSPVRAHINLTWKSMMTKSVCWYISVTAAQLIRDSWLWDFLTFAALALCFLNVRENMRIASQRTASDLYSFLRDDLTPRRFVSQALASSTATTWLHYFYRTWEFLENVRVRHIDSVCVVSGKTLSVKDKRLHTAHIAGASFPRCSVGHANRLNAGVSTVCPQLLHNHPLTLHVNCISKRDNKVAGI